MCLMVVAPIFGIVEPKGQNKKIQALVLRRLYDNLPIVVVSAIVLEMCTVVPNYVEEEIYAFIGPNKNRKFQKKPDLFNVYKYIIVLVFRQCIQEPN